MKRTLDHTISIPLHRKQEWGQKETDRES